MVRGRNHAERRVERRSGRSVAVGVEEGRLVAHRGFGPADASRDGVRIPTRAHEGRVLELLGVRERRLSLELGEAHLDPVAQRGQGLRSE